MSQMVEEFEHSLLEGSDEKKLYEDISSSLKRSYGRYDLETVLSVLESLESQDNMHPFVAFINDRLKKCSIPPIVTNESATSASLIRKLKDFLVNECKFDGDNYQKNQIVYKNLLDNVVAEIENTSNSGDFMCNIYTTNYDCYLDRFLEERFSEQYYYKITDYFEKTGKPPYLNIFDEYFLKSYNPNNEYVKLHGSIDWFSTPNGKVVKTSNPFPTYTPDIMIYPTSDKPLYREPWIMLMMLFKRALKQTDYWIAIGYSFNDEYIRNMFLENLSSDPPKHKLAIISPSAEETKGHFFNENSNVKGFNCKIQDIVKCKNEIIEWIKGK